MFLWLAEKMFTPQYAEKKWGCLVLAGLTFAVAFWVDVRIWVIWALAVVSGFLLLSSAEWFRHKVSVLNHLNYSILEWLEEFRPYFATVFASACVSLMIHHWHMIAFFVLKE